MLTKSVSALLLATPWWRGWVCPWDWRWPRPGGREWEWWRDLLRLTWLSIDLACSVLLAVPTSGTNSPASCLASALARSPLSSSRQRSWSWETSGYLLQRVPSSRDNISSSDDRTCRERSDQTSSLNLLIPRPVWPQCRRASQSQPCHRQHPWRKIWTEELLF